MAHDETSIPEGVRDILKSMPPEIRARVLAEYESRYAPFLGMLAGWKAAIQTHYVYGENSAIARLQEQFFPLGSWQFPSQGLAVPLRRMDRLMVVPANAQFTDEGRRLYTPCGEGWVLPTELQSATVRPKRNAWMVQADIAVPNGMALEPLLARGQLAFVAAPEVLLPHLEAAQWWVQTPENRIFAVQCTRNDSFMTFEHEMRAARMRQRQLDLWLPPFYPYSRKMVVFRLTESLGGASPFSSDDLPTAPESGFRLIGWLENLSGAAETAVRDIAEQITNAPWLWLNAIPLVQTGVSDRIFYPPYPRIGQEYGARLAGMPSIFAAVTYHDAVAVPAALMRVPSSDPLSSEPDALVQFGHTDAGRVQIKLYHNSIGATPLGTPFAPGVLKYDPLQMTLTFPLMGGMTTDGEADRAAWAQTAWYHSVLRPPLLTEGDVIEIIRERQQMLGELLTFHHARRGIVRDVDARNAHWKSYLWPSLVAREDSFGIAAEGGIPADGIPLLQSLQIAFTPGSQGQTLPAFLQDDAAHYLASTLSAYFVLSSFRVEGGIVSA